MAEQIGSADIQGLEELKARFAQLPITIRKKFLVKAVRSGSELIRKLMEYKAPRRSGNLGAQIVIKIDDSSPASVTASIGPSQKAWYGRLVERGTQPHIEIRKDGGEFHHPGAKAKPFIRPAWDEGQDEAARIVADELAFQISSEIGQ